MLKHLPALLLYLFLKPALAFACQCGEIPGTKEAFSKVPIVVAGRVIAVRQGALVAGFSERTVTLQLERVWKGARNAKLQLVVGLSNCDYINFQSGKSYLIFAEPSRQQPGAWTASKCMPTKLVAEAAADLEILGSGESATQPDSAPRTSARSGEILAVLAIGALAALSILFVVVARRSRA